jgi:hypothetical protein
VRVPRRRFLGREALRHFECDHVGDAPGDLAGQPAFFCLARQCGTSRVDHSGQGKLEFGGQSHTAPRLPQRSRAERRLGRLAVPVLTQQHARLVAESYECEQKSRLVFALPGSVEQQDVGAGMV